MFRCLWLKSTACLLLVTFPLQSVVAAGGGAISAPVPQAEQANADPRPEKEGVRHEAERPSQTPNFAELGKAAKALGQSQAASLKDHAGAVQEGTVTVPQLKDGRFKSGNTRVHMDDLFPGTRRDHSDPDGTYFPKGQKPDLERLKQLHDANKEMGEAGQSAKKGLWKDSQAASPSLAGSAYQVILDASKRSRPDFAEDPALDQSKQTYEKIDDIAKWFGDCKTDTEYQKRERLTHIPEYHHCTRLYKPAGGCTIQHTIEIDTEPTDVVFLVDNSASMDPVIADLRNNVRTFANLMMQGKAHNLRMSGAAYRDKDYLWNNIPFSYAYSDFQHWINGVRTERAETYPFAVVRWAIDHYPWRENVHRIIVLIGNDDYGCGFNPGQSFCPSRAEIIRALQEKGIQLYIFHNNADVQSIGIPLADYFAGPKLLKFAQFFTIVTDHWSPQSCINDARATLEPFCKGRYTPWPRDENACVTISGFDICKGDPLYQKLKAPPLPNVPRQAARVEVSALSCDYNHGQGTCWVDAQGRRQCLRNDQDIDQCQTYERNSACGFISSTCIGGTQGVSGHCYVREDTYDCGKEVKVPTLDKSTKYRCAGPVRCMGEDCLSVDQEASTDFAKAAALLQAAQFMTQDTDCEDVTGHDNLYCRAFTGQPSECKVAVGGVQNCCKNPQYPSLGDYLTLILSMPKLDTALMEIGDSSALAGVKGAYQLLRNPVLKGWTEVTKPFASFLENITGAVHSFTQPVSTVGRQAVSKLTGEVTKVTTKVIGNAASSVGSAVPVGAPKSMAEQILGSQGAAMLSTAMTAYTAYVVTLMMIKLIWKCEKAEFEMNAKRHLKSCTYLGSYCKTDAIGLCIEKRESYCCFNSPLSRIIQEQVRLQLRMPFGDAEHPQCDGIPMERLAEVDWGQVNLDEWLGILQESRHFPEPGHLTPEALTGQGSPLNTEGDRKEVIERTRKRLEGVEVDALRKKAGKMVKPDVGAE